MINLTTSMKLKHLLSSLKDKSLPDRNEFLSGINMYINQLKESTLIVKKKFLVLGFVPESDRVDKFFSEYLELVESLELVNVLNDEIINKIIEVIEKEEEISKYIALNTSEDTIEEKLNKDEEKLNKDRATELTNLFSCYSFNEHIIFTTKIHTEKFILDDNNIPLKEIVAVVDIFNKAVCQIPAEHYKEEYCLDVEEVFNKWEKKWKKS